LPGYRSGGYGESEAKAFRSWWLSSAGLSLLSAKTKQWRILWTEEEETLKMPYFFYYFTLTHSSMYFYLFFISSHRIPNRLKNKIN
jgi:TRAP-type C4-dicarboxylate transport system permease small subunit